MIIYLKVASKVTIIRSTPTAAVLNNFYNTIRNTIHDTDAYYTTNQIEALKRDPNNKFIQLNNKGANNAK